MIAIGRFDGVLAAAKAMLPYLFKKAIEARAVIDYYEGRIAGNDLVAVFQREVEAGRRERRDHTVKVDVPYPYPEGHALMKERRRRRIQESITKTRAKVTRRDFETIREEHFRLRVPLTRLVEKYPNYSRETIRRVLGGGRGYVLVKGRGIVVTTNCR